MGETVPEKTSVEGMAMVIRRNKRARGDIYVHIIYTDKEQGGDIYRVNVRV